MLLLEREKERRVIIIHPSSGCCCRQWEVKRDKRYKMSVTFVLGSFVTLYRIRVLYEERGRERGAGISPPKDQFLSPPPLPDLGHNICNISQKHKLYMYVNVASILLKACKAILFYRGGLGRWGGGQCFHTFSVICASRKYSPAQQGSPLSQNSNPV